MAASASAGVTGRRGRRGRGQHGRGGRRRPGGGTEGALKRLKRAVEEFVQATSEGEILGSLAGSRAEGREEKPQGAGEGEERNKGWNN